MISDDEQENYPEIININNNNLSNNLIKSSPANRNTITESSWFQNRIKIIYSLTSISVSLIGIYILAVYPLIQQYSIIYFYFFNYTFIWPMSVFLTLIIVKLYKLLHQPSHQALSHQMSTEVTPKSKETEIESIMLMILLLLCYFFSIPHTIMFIVKLITLRNMFEIRDLYLFSTFPILNILSSIIFYQLAFMSYSQRKSGDDIDNLIDNSNDFNSVHSIEKKLKHNQKKKQKKDNVLHKYESNIVIDVEFLKKIELEVSQSKKISGIIEPSPELMTINNYFNKQTVSYINQQPNEPNESNEYNSFRSRGSITSVNEIDYNAIEKDKRDRQKEAMKQKIKLNILTEEDEEDARKNQLIAKMNKQFKKSKSKDNNSLSIPIIQKTSSFEVNDNIQSVKAKKSHFNYAIQDMSNNNDSA